ncbi:hypothetical protein [Oceanobacillus bengalensis]|uniref:hypothetical protein n=1 Tax=Oceanobacillus bengalensis TaxID=1435466 RepID=UPI0036D303CD
MIEKYNKEKVSFKDVSSFNLDEYVGLSRGNPIGYQFYMYDKLFRHIDILKGMPICPKGLQRTWRKNAVSTRG